MEIKIINPGERDEEKLDQFYQQAYRPDHILTDRKFRHWWLRDNPFWRRQTYSCKVAMAAGEFVGHCAYVPAPLWFAGQTYRAAWGGNFIVSERFRGQGIGRKLHQAINDEVDVFLDVGANVSAQAILSKFGWTNFGRLHRAVGILDYRAAAAFSRESVSPRRELKRVETKSSADLIFEELAEFDETTDKLWQKLKSQAPIAATERNHHFLNWRYAKHPYFTYRTFAVRRGEEIVGLAVCRFQLIKETQIKIMKIAEFLALKEARLPLLRQLIDQGRQANAALIDFFCASETHLNFFADLGFCLSSAADQFTRLFDPVDLTRPGFNEISFNGGNIHQRLAKEIFNNQENWYVTIGDGDQDRPNRLSA